jgi:hypothetical protein
MEGEADTGVKWGRPLQSCPASSREGSLKRGEFTRALESIGQTCQPVKQAGSSRGRDCRRKEGDRGTFDQHPVGRRQEEEEESTAN